jgi:type IX secretion system PorP/SprF family membrane protein
MRIKTKKNTYYILLKTRCLATLVFCFLSCFSYSQTEITYNQFWNNYSIINPAASGLFSKKYISISRNIQNTFIKNNPKTFSFIIDHRFRRKDCAMGISFKNDKYGYYNSNKFNINYSYQLRISENGKFSMGASVNTTGFNYSPDYLVSLIVKEQHGRLIDFNVGMMVKTKRLVIGLSTVNFNQSKYVHGNFTYQNQRYLFSNISYDFQVLKNLVVRPGILLKTNFEMNTFDYNLLLKLKDKYRIGFTYRPKGKIAFTGGLDLNNKIRIGYSYITTTKKENNDILGPSHEFGIVFLLN